jgi:hypothetical protein
MHLAGVLAEQNLTVEHPVDIVARALRASNEPTTTPHPMRDQIAQYLRNLITRTSVG